MGPPGGGGGPGRRGAITEGYFVGDRPALMGRGPGERGEGPGRRLKFCHPKLRHQCRTTRFRIRYKKSPARQTRARPLIMCVHRAKSFYFTQLCPWGPMEKAGGRSVFTVAHLSTPSGTPGESPGLSPRSLGGERWFSWLARPLRRLKEGGKHGGRREGLKTPVFRN